MSFTVLRALALNDLRAIRRDSMYLMILLLPVVGVGLLRLGIGPLTDWALAVGVDLVPWYPVIALELTVLGTTLMFGAIGGFLLLDERDAGTLAALRVTPVTPLRYAGYRLGLLLLLATLYALVLTPLTGIYPADLLPVLPLVAVTAAWFAPVVALGLAAFATNKVEGIALSKGFGLFMAAPLVVFFLAAPWQWVGVVLPTWWPARVLLAGMEGEAAWAWALGGVAVQVVLVVVLFRVFTRRLDRG